VSSRSAPEMRGYAELEQDVRRARNIRSGVSPGATRARRREARQSSRRWTILTDPNAAGFYERTAGRIGE